MLLLYRRIVGQTRSDRTTTMFFMVLGAYFAFAAFFIYVLIMGPSRYHRDGYIGALHRRMQRCPSLTGQFLCCLASCGNWRKGVQKYAALEERIMMKRHPTLQIFYLVLMAACYFFFFTHVYPMLPPWSAARIISASGSILAILIYAVACWKDPGVVTAAEERGKMSEAARTREDALNLKYAGDGVLFPLEQNKKDCATCHVPKPARSKHCKICGHCVRRFDHHCAWLNADIGEGNVFWFHAFLVWHVLLSMLYAALGTLVLLSWIDKERLWDATFVAKGGGGRVKATWRVVFMYTLGHHPAIIALTLFAAMVAVMLFVFWFTNLKLAWRNQTSNEAYKCDEYSIILASELRDANKKRREARAQRAADDNEPEAGPGQKKKAKGQRSSMPDESIAATASPASARDGADDLMTPAMMKEELRKAAAAYDLGSWARNIFDTFGWISPAEATVDAKAPKDGAKGGSTAKRKKA
jgi:hypothetical protein